MRLYSGQCVKFAELLAFVLVDVVVVLVFVGVFHLCNGYLRRIEVVD